MLLKALEEVANAPNSMMAAEMAIIRLTHVADLPSPEELVSKLKDTPVPSGPPPSGARGSNGHHQTPVSSANVGTHASITPTACKSWGRTNGACPSADDRSGPRFRHLNTWSV